MTEYGMRTLSFNIPEEELMGLHVVLQDATKQAW